MKVLCTLALASLFLTAISARPDETEKVNVRYELAFNRCRGESCNQEIVAQGETLVSLYQEDASSGFVGYTPVELHVGSLAYQLRFDVSRELKQRKARHLMLGFSGRVGTLTGKQVTWAENSFTGNTWGDFDKSSIAGNEYSEEDEKITPTLRLINIRAQTDNSLMGRASLRRANQ